MFQQTYSASLSSQKEEEKDYIHFYESDSDNFPPPPPPEHLYDFEQELKTSTDTSVEINKKNSLRPLASMADLVVKKVESLSTQEVCYNDLLSGVSCEESLMYFYKQNKKE